MVNKLRKKFVITAMLSLLLILIAMVAVINIINVYQTVSDSDRLLSMLSDNDGYFPGMPENDQAPPVDAQQSKPVRDFSPGPLGFARLNDMKSAEMPYQARYFWVRYNSDGTVKELNMHIASIDEEQAKTYAQTAAVNKKTKGFIHNFRYLVTSKDNGDKLVILSDMSSQLVGIYKLLFQSVAIGILALIAMFILVFLFSGQAVAPVVESLEKQKRFITDAGHELKTPLAVISANVDVLELESGKNEWSSSIKNQVRRMNDLVKNLLTLSRMDEERMHVVFSDFDMSKTISDAASSFEALAASKGKNYVADIEDGIHITGDKGSITQLASLLLDNAIKYSSEKGSIHVSLSQNKNIVFEVSNTCDSILTGNLDRLFDRFYRADSSRSRDTGGYGIGLSVARAIAVSHGGNIEALRDGDKIIRFVVTLPKVLPKNLMKTK